MSPVAVTFLQRNLQWSLAVHPDTIFRRQYSGVARQPSSASRSAPQLIRNETTTAYPQCNAMCIGGSDAHSEPESNPGRPDIVPCHALLGASQHTNIPFHNAGGSAVPSLQCLPPRTLTSCGCTSKGTSTKCSTMSHSGA